MKQTKNNFPDIGLDCLDNKDTLIASLWFDNNHGSILSAYALYQCLEMLGRKPVLLNRPADLWTDQYDDPNSRSWSFIYKNCSVAKKNLAEDELNKCDLFLAGPGSIWEQSESRKNSSTFFLGDMVRSSMKRVSWASSFGKTEGKIPPKSLLNMKKLLNLYDSISVRSEYNAGFCSDNFSIHPDIILDPVFLCDAKHYIQCIDSSDFKSVNPYIFTYIENADRRRTGFIEEGMFVRNMCCLDFEYPLGINVLETGNNSGKPGRTEDWLAAVYNSDYVVTDDYYGACFAILFEKPFIVMAPDNFYKHIELEELLACFHLQERFVPCDHQTDLKDYMYLFRKGIDYKKIRPGKDFLVNESLKWVRTNIAGD